MKVKPKSKEEVLKFIEIIENCWDEWLETKSKSGNITIEGRIWFDCKVKSNLRDIEDKNKCFLNVTFVYCDKIAELIFDFTFDDKFNVSELLSDRRVISTIHFWMDKFNKIGDFIENYTD